MRKFATDITEECELWVTNYGVQRLPYSMLVSLMGAGEPPEINQSIKMEVGIEDCLHIEFEYGRSKYHLKVLFLGERFIP